MDDSPQVPISHVSLTVGNPHLAGYPHFIAHLFLFWARAIHQALGIASWGFYVALPLPALPLISKHMSALCLMFRQCHWPLHHHPSVPNFYFCTIAFPAYPAVRENDIYYVYNVSTMCIIYFPALHAPKKACSTIVSPPCTLPSSLKTLQGVSVDSLGVGMIEIRRIFVPNRHQCHQ